MALDCCCGVVSVLLVSCIGMEYSYYLGSIQVGDFRRRWRMEWHTLTRALFLLSGIPVQLFEILVMR